MPRTRNSGGLAGQPQRASLARRTKPKNLYLDESDVSGDEGADDSDVSLGSIDDDVTDDDVDSRIDRNIGDLDIHPSTSDNKTRKAASARKEKVQVPLRSRGKTQSDRPRVKQPAPTTPRGVKRQRNDAITPRRSSQKPAESSGGAKSSIVHSGVIPNWLHPAIPYSAWLDIFYYAATAGGSLDNSWLLHAATTCKAFAEPALTTLYQCPSPVSNIKAKKLATLLETPPHQTLFNYRTKVEAIYINIDKFPLGLLPQVIQPLRRLKELIIFSPLDQPPYRDLDKTIRWSYPDELFSALTQPESAVLDNQTPIILKSWEWSSRLLGGHVADLGDISAIHRLPNFANLTKLGFTNFQVPSLNKAEAKPDDEAGAQQLYDEDGQVIDAVADSIAQLSSLKHLTFESSTIMTDRLLSQLPKDLLHLELINCWEVRSDDLASFLQGHGNSLRTLTLNHNQSLDLGFLTDFATSCPHLRELHMNLSYYRHHDSLDDADPMYEQALLPTQLPLWPSTLRVLRIEHVRQWSVEAAEMFLQSLVDSAPDLPDLRHLAIKSMLNIPWQRRAELRRGWREKLERVFLRSDAPPRNHTTLHPSDINDNIPSSPVRKRKRKDPGTPSRRSGRIAANASDSDHSSRLRGSRKARPLYRDPDTDEDEVEEDEAFSEDERPSASGGEEDDGPKLPVQGMCHTVSILFDNQKVRELQYGMEDFNDGGDSESSGEEWNGDEEEDDPVFRWR